MSKLTGIKLSATRSQSRSPFESKLRSKSLWAGTASAAALSIAALPLNLSSAWAQEADAPDGFEMADDVMAVTGSNLRMRRDYSSPSPVQTLGQPELQNTGSVRLQDLFKGITANSGSQTSNRQNALQGVSQFSLRGLGIGSTLTLVNGRRAGLSPVTDATGQLFTDSNQFPVNMIDRIEVLTDGASATYGSEAVAGVVNIITREDFEGFELTAEARDSTHEAYQIGAAFGNQFDRGSFQLFLNYYDQGGNFRGDLDFIRARDADNQTDPDFNFGGVFNSGTGSPGRFDRALPDGEGGFERVGDTVADPDCVAAGGILRGSACRYNFIDQRRIIAEEQRFQAFSQVDFQVTDQLNLYSEVSFSRNEIRDALGGAVLRVTTQDGGFLVPGDHPFNFFVADGAENIVYAGPEAFANDASLEAVDVIFRGRPLGSAFDGPNAEDIVTTFDNLRFVGGFDYELNESWVLSGNFQVSDNSYTRQQPRDYGAEEFQDAILSGAWNPFGTAVANPALVSPKDGVSTAENSDQDLRLFSFTINEIGEVTQQVAEAVLSGDTGWQLGGGSVAIALGAQYRELAFEFTPDSRRQSGNNGRGETEAAIPRTEQDVYAIFAEAALPITEQFEAQLALRYEDYGDQGGDTVDPKISLKYDISDQFALRGSFGTSFQAPSIRQVSGAVGSAGVSDPLDPAGGTFNVTVFTSGSPGLESQSAENFNLGAILTLDNGLDISLDYFDYEYEDLILPGGDPQSIIDADPNGAAVLRDASGQLNAVFTGFENRGDASISGFDLNAVYEAEWFTAGSLVFNASTTVITEFESSEFAGLDGDGDLRGSRNFANAFGSTPDFKANGGVTWSTDKHLVNVSLRHIGEYTDDQSGEDIDSHTTVDARYTLSLDVLGGQADLTLGVVDLFDEDIPEIESRPLFDTEVHDPRGRQVYIGLKQTF